MSKYGIIATVQEEVSLFLNEEEKEYEMEDDREYSVNNPNKLF